MTLVLRDPKGRRVVEVDDYTRRAGRFARVRVENDEPPGFFPTISRFFNYKHLTITEETE